MKSFFADSKWFIFAALNLSFCAVLLAGAAAGGGSLAKLPYVVLLFALCTSPIPFIERPNGPFAMLGVTLGIYFVTLGLSDAVSMFAPPTSPDRESLLSAGEMVILVGISMLILGFHLAASLAKPKAQEGAPKDWPRSTLLVAGLLLWSAGCAAELYRSLVVVSDNSNAATLAGFANLGIWLTSVLILVQVYAAPLGVIILAYWWVVTGRRSGTVLVVLVVLCQFVVGWVVDTKSVALGAPFIILLTRFFVLGRVPLRWVMLAVVGVALVFPVLTTKRAIMGEEHLTRMQALPRTAEILWRAIEQRDAYRNVNRYGDATSTFLERITVKSSVEIFAEYIGKTHPYRMGSTLEPLLYVFVPRVLWSDKPTDSAPQSFNREFHISANPDTYISPTHMGEMYWNFGYPGIIIGMALLGALLGYVNVRFDPSARTSITRVLVIMVTIYELIAHGEGSIGNEYVVWVRTVLLIGIFHLIFARPVARQIVERDAKTGTGVEEHDSAPLALFPNLLR